MMGDSAQTRRKSTTSSWGPFYKAFGEVVQQGWIGSHRGESHMAEAEGGQEERTQHCAFGRE